MLRSLISVYQTVPRLLVNRPVLATTASPSCLVSQAIQRNFSLFQTNTKTPFINVSSQSVDTLRTLTKFSRITGKRKAVKAVVGRFYRLHWGIWIRRLAGCHKKLWKKSFRRRKRLRQHVFCNATQSRLLDKMVTNFWRRPKYYVNDPYEPYHSREEFCSTAVKPRPYFPPEQLQK